MSAANYSELNVALGKRSYPIYIGNGLESLISDYVAGLKASNRPMMLITDSTVDACQREFIDSCFSDAHKWILPAGESNKNLTNFADALEFFASNGLDRSSVMFAFGGGVVGDFAGYVSASYMRGVDFVQVPTTLLAMVDSSVGGKTGVNLKAGKNLVGAFNQPQAVYIDLDRLETLPDREFASGLAEVIKAGMLADLSFFETLEALPKITSESPELADIIKHSCQIKADVVAADERESAASGGRALLNLGHTFGHAIEQCTQYSKYLHGEAISIGMMMAAELSETLGNISVSDKERIENVFVRNRLPVRLESPLSKSALTTAMGRDKKKKQGTLKYVVLEKLGVAKTQADICKEAIDKALEFGGANEPEA